MGEKVKGELKLFRVPSIPLW